MHRKGAVSVMRLGIRCMQAPEWDKEAELHYARGSPRGEKGAEMHAAWGRAPELEKGVGCSMHGAHTHA